MRIPERIFLILRGLKDRGHIAQGTAPGEDAAQGAAPAGDAFWLARRPRAALTLIGLFVLLHYLVTQAAGDSAERAAFYLVVAGAKVNALIAAGEWWRLVASAFLHAGFSHLVVNCLGVLIAGWLLEAALGASRFLVVFVLSAAGGALASYLLSDLPSAGASGGMFGLLGGTAAFGVVRWRTLPRLLRIHVAGLPLVVAAFSLGYGLLSRGVDNWSHAGGFLAGILTTLAALALPREPHGSIRFVLRAGHAVFILALAYSLAATAAHLARRFDPPLRDLAVAQEGEDDAHFVPAGWNPGTFREGRCVLDARRSRRAPATDASAPLSCYVDPFYSIYLVGPSDLLAATPVFAEHAARNAGNAPAQYTNDRIMLATAPDRGLSFALLAFDDLADKYMPLFAAMQCSPAKPLPSSGAL